ncbi:MAG: DUF1109 domain-containing protein [Alphaproteobacteria bacterium]|nr:DUF1109 domain-containing protein [Alphaproteobacteria bacterium]
MKTDDLIRTLSAEPPARGMTVAARLALALVPGLAVAALLFAVILGPRDDVATAFGHVRFVLKPIEALALAALAALVLVRLAQPGAGASLRALLAVPAALLLAVAVELVRVPRAQWATLWVGDNWARCLSLIPLLALAPLAAALLALRHGAPTRPALAGAVAGVLAGGLGAALYAIHCTDDSPLFVATWYTLAIAVTAGLGTFLGARLLRW